MYNYGVGGIWYDGFESYFINRKQYCCVLNVCSDICCLKFGVPQRSVLDTLLFLIYVNDIGNMYFYSPNGNAVPHVNVTIFADDTNLFIVDHDTVELNLNANWFSKSYVHGSYQ